MITPEIWRAIPGYEGRYEISSHGLVKSLAKCGKSEKFLFPDTGRSKGYLSVCLYDGNIKSKRYLIHALVMLTFVGKKPTGKETCHNDGDRKNNNLNNLRYDTPVSNQNDSLRHGTRLIGSQKKAAKLTELDVMRIRERRAGETAKKLAHEFNMHPVRIQAIRNGVDWKHVNLGELLCHII